MILLMTLVTEAITEFIIGVLAEWVRAIIVEAIANVFAEIALSLITEWIAEAVTGLLTELKGFVKTSLALT
ncbi:MAG TPA: hypothetical protein V6D25_09465 [Leptolyngbyaceae cyanobacterium]